MNEDSVTGDGNLGDITDVSVSRCRVIRVFSAAWVEMAPLLTESYSYCMYQVCNVIAEYTQKIVTSKPKINQS